MGWSSLDYGAGTAGFSEDDVEQKLEAFKDSVENAKKRREKVTAAELRAELEYYERHPNVATANPVLINAAREWLAVLERNTPTLSSLFIVCSHGRRSAHALDAKTNSPAWCPGGRPVTLEDLGGEKVWWCSTEERTYKRETPEDICAEFHRRRKCGWRILILIPDSESVGVE